MAITIQVKIISANADANGIVKITIEFDDGIGKWQKTYDYSQTKPIDFSQFKDRITEDLRRDLKIKDQLSNINEKIGKTFNITI